MEINDKAKTFIFRHENLILRDHQVHQTSLVPGVTYLDVMYRIAKDEKFLSDKLVINNLLFNQPLATTQSFDRQARVTFNNINNQNHFVISSQYIQGDLPIPNSGVKHAEGVISSEKPFIAKNFDFKKIKQRAKQVFSLARLYDYAQSLHIVHGPFMKTQGEVYLGDNEVLAKIAVSDLAALFLNQFYLHPALLDGSTLLAFAPYFELARDIKPAIPFFIRSFQTLGNLPSPCYVYVSQLADQSMNQDTFESNLEFYAEDGSQVAFMEGLIFKRIRQPELITKLTELPILVNNPVENPKDFKSSLLHQTESSETNITEHSCANDKVINKTISQMLQEHFNLKLGVSDWQRSFYEIGLDSSQLVELVRLLEKQLNVQLYPTLLFEYETINKLTNYLAEKYGDVYSSKIPEKSQTVPSRLTIYQPIWQIEKIRTIKQVNKLIVIGASFNQINALQRMFECYAITQPLNDIQLEQLPAEFSHILYVGSYLDTNKDILEIFKLTQMLMQSNRYKDIHLLYVMSSSGVIPYGAMIVGFANTLRLENPHYQYKVVQLPQGIDDTTWSKTISAELSAEFITKSTVNYEDNQRYVKHFQAVDISSNQTKLPLRQHGIYLITGGLKGLGFIFAQYLAEHYQARLILCGRSLEKAINNDLLDKLRILGSEVLYLAADVSKEAEVEAVIQQSTRHFGALHGIFHCAGIIKDSLLIAKHVNDFEQVLAPKVQGIINLDKATVNEKLDFMVLFSSVAGVIGNVGQCDYASANSFLDAFAYWRNQQAEKGLRQGRTFSINWPLWATGGMQIDKASQAYLADILGMQSMSTEIGLKAFEAVLGLYSSQTMIIYGDKAKFENYLHNNREKKGQLDASNNNLLLADNIPKAEISQRQIDATAEESIAIIGVSGRYPKAKNLQEFWDNLVQGKDCITEVPSERWNHHVYFDMEKNKPGKIYSKWGGFIEDYDKFDPLFFNISPKDAELMDPQERLFLEVAWQTLEDAGYTPERLGQGYAANHQAVGVFVGVMYGLYQLYSRDHISTDSFYASIANRISYYLNLHGPSLAVDTMCSSSLTAIHLACESIKRGECQVALAGGVNITSHPYKYHYLSQRQFLSTDGKCRSFGEGGDGYVPGEGVGAVLLKPLSKALTDGDIIYGVIKGSSINHGGKVNGYTVPNPIAQGELILDAFKRAKLTPDMINYLEAHGTGTSLGDPIEINGLNKAFANANIENCPIGSVKSNIGHLESAAGIAALTKVLLQLKYKQLVPSIHSETLNPHINFSKTKFYVQQALSDWLVKPNCLRRAGISSFGAGGSNASIIVEEAPEQVRPVFSNKPYYLICISAKQEQVLKQRIQDLLAWLESLKPVDTIYLESISYTLNAGRTHFLWRCCVVAASIEELQQKLTALQNGESTEGCFYYDKAKGLKDEENAIYTEALTSLLLKLKATKYQDEKNYFNQLCALASLYVKGYDLDWNLLHQGEAKQKISLPVYPFLKERYWVENSTLYGMSEIKHYNQSSTQLHPLIDSNSSTFHQQCFIKKFTGKESYLNEHKVLREKVFPGASYLEMVRAAGELAAQLPVISIEEVMWVQPMVVNDDIEVRVELTVLTNNQATFKVISQIEEKLVTFCEGKLNYAPMAQPEPLDLKAIYARCSERSTNKAFFYQQLNRMGFDYGASFQVMCEIAANEQEALVQLALPIETDARLYQLPPSLIDGALRSVLGFQLVKDNLPSLSVPFYLKSLHIHQTLPTTCYAYVKLSTEQDVGFKKYDIVLCNETGEVLVSLNGFVGRAYEKANTFHQVYSYSASWQPAPISGLTKDQNNNTSLLVFANSEQVINNLITYFPHAQWVTPGDTCAILAAGYYQINFQDKEHYLWLARKLKEHAKLPEIIIKQCQITAKPFDSNISSLANNTLAITPLLYWFQAIEATKSGLKQLYVQVYNNPISQSLYDASVSFGRAVKLINPQFAVKVIHLTEADAWNLVKLEMQALAENQSVRYLQQARQVWLLKPHLLKPANQPVPLKSGGVYLIIGGLGGIGYHIANHLARCYQAVLILTGRGVLDEVKVAKVKALEAQGAQAAWYASVDVCDYVGLEALFAKISQSYQLNGIIHSAGVMVKQSVMNITQEQFSQSLAAKVLGTQYLDSLSQHEKLDFFVTFSSISAYTGDYGAGSYAYANHFMDRYMAVRSERVQQGHGSGKSISILWPYWAEGGLSLEAEDEKVYFDYLGLTALSTAQGIQLFEQALALDITNILFILGQQAKVQQLLGLAEVSSLATKPVAQMKVASAAKNQLQQATETYLKKLLKEITKLPLDKIDMQTTYEHYGFDSIMIINFNQRLSQDFKGLRKTLLFEYQTLASLVEYLITEQQAQLNKVLNLTTPETTSLPSQPTLTDTTSSSLPFQLTTKPTLTHSLPTKSQPLEAIAVIGVSGRYPQADNLALFWENLKSGKDCIIEIPRERWDYRPYFAGEKNSAGKLYCKWGGFISDVDKFDPLFFAITPDDAERMDPQERLLLQTAWETMEDAGYNPWALHQKSQKRVGVFVGTMWNEYQLISEANLGYGNSNNASLANRLSYHLNLNGPSLVIDTACSSSLVALHTACESIRLGECDFALAGGVNLSLHPSKYVNLSQLGMLSPTGRCHSFGEKGDGYVPGEGVGLVLLKSLAQALIDKDTIYGVIRSSSVNHGGKTHGFTVPNPEAQQDLIKQALAKAAIDPASISYVEAHGTGTSLGDPIEVTGLQKAFGDGLAKQSCAIGSVKSNVGHLEGAAGIVAFTKVLLQLKHKQLVPSIHSTSLNPNIDFTETSFYVQQELSAWKPKAGYPRRAGISSFGAGGSNAHVIVEEAPERNNTLYANKPYYLLTLSAKHEEGLKKRIQALLEWLEQYKADEKVHLESVSYTLNIGRAHFAWRCSLVVSSLSELLEKLTQILNQAKVANCFYAQVEKEPDDAIIYKKLLKSSLNELLQPSENSHENYQENLVVLANLYIKGYELDWELLHQGEAKQKLNLPTYLFLKESYWITLQHQKLTLPHATNILAGSYLHPLVHCNLSTLTEQCYQTTLCSESFYLKDHIIAGQSILPGAALLEMARAAGALALSSSQIIGIEDVVWLTPISIDGTQQVVEIGLNASTSMKVDYEIRTLLGSEKVIHGQGTLLYDHHVIEKINYKHALSLDELQERLQQTLEHESLYSTFAKQGFTYGLSFKPLQWVKSDGQSALGYLQLPESIKFESERKNYLLHPSLLDGALQTVMGLQIAQGRQQESLYLPFAVSKVELFAAIPDNCYVLVNLDITQQNTRYYDIQITNEAGEVIVVLKGLSARVLSPSKKHQLNEAVNANFSPSSVAYYITSWQKSLPRLSTKTNKITAVLFIGDELPQQLSELKAILSCEVYTQSFKTDLTLITQQPAKISHIVYLASSEYVDNTTDIRALFNLTRILLSQRYRKIELLYLVENASPYQLMMSGFAKAIQLENPDYCYRLVNLPPKLNSQDKFNIIIKELQIEDKIAGEIRYENGIRYNKSLEAITPAQLTSGSLLLKRDGVYLITGGLGGLGFIFAQYLAEHYHARLVLVGRSSLTAEKQTKIQRLEALGSEVLYIAADIVKASEVQAIIIQIKSRFGQLNGIIHSAGVLKDKLLNQKTLVEFEAVLAPKVTGLMYLDEYTQSEPLDVFILFSSMASVVGNIGQTDYASANAFLDNFAYMRNTLVEQQQRHGKTLTINWPLWIEGGMQIDETVEHHLAEEWGMKSLPTHLGLKSFEQIISLNLTQTIIFYGDTSKLEATWISKKSEPKLVLTANHSKENLSQLQDRTQAYLKELMQQELKLPASKIGATTLFEYYGIDSIAAVKLTRSLEKTLGPLPKTLFFEYQTIEAVANYLIEINTEKLLDMFSLKPAIQMPIKVKEEKLGLRFIKHDENKIRNQVESSITDIAIIGLSGRYPQANNLEEFWENLKAGRNCIESVPAGRWNNQFQYYGGFIHDISKFDAAFFNMLSEEAENLPPELRLLLEVVWEVMENAGYTRAHLTRYQEEKSIGIGVFIANMYQQYPFAAQNLDKAAQMSVYFPGMLANYLSHFFNLQGPSLTLDTACAGSLTAIHMACESIRQGQSIMALAGGTNLHLHPAKFNVLINQGLISQRNISQGLGLGDGYIPGEGIGAILLKPLQLAIQDKDLIYGVIKHGSINHSGTTITLTAPNPTAQANSIIQTFHKAAINPATITYVECAANGAQLGDALEIKGLKKAFQSFNNEKQYCAIGTVKSNIGHLEAASGISQLTKVLCQMRHGLLVPSINAEPLNPEIDLDNSPFYLQSDLCKWQKPIVNGYEHPRRALISSFGAGGANAHLLVEEFIQTNNDDVKEISTPLLFLFSAKTKIALTAQINNFIHFLSANSTVSLLSVAYTLQLGREVMEYRLAVQAASVEELSDQLSQFMQDNIKTPYLWCNCIDKSSHSNNENSPSIFNKDELDNIIQKNDLTSLALAWINGAVIPWQNLYSTNKPKKIALPTYPFARMSYWLTDVTYLQENQQSQNDMIVKIPDNSVIEKKLIELLREMLVHIEETIDSNKKLNEYRINSLRGIRFLNRINQFYQIQLEPRYLVENPTIKLLSQQIRERLTEKLQVLGNNCELNTTHELSAQQQSNLTTRYREHIPQFIVRTYIPIDRDSLDFIQTPHVKVQKDLLDLLEQGFGVWKEKEYLVIEHAKTVLKENIIAKIGSKVQDIADYLMDDRRYYPLSFSQQMMCVQSEIYNNPAYQLVIPFALSKKLIPSLLNKSIAILLSHHQVLRTTFPKIQSKWVQVIHADRNITIEIKKLSTDPFEHKAAVLELMQKEKKFRFNISSGPLLRLHLLQVANISQDTAIKDVLLLNIHHAICDGVAISLFTNQLSMIYSQLEKNLNVSVPKYLACYGHYVIEQFNWNSNQAESNLAWWRKQLQEAPSYCPLPYDSLNNSKHIKQGKVVSFVISNADKLHFDKFCRQENVSLTILVLTGLYILIQQWTKQYDIVIGTILNQRHRLEYEDLLGDFTNIIPLRMQFQEHSTGRQLLQKVQTMFAESYAHQNITFGQLIRQLNNSRKHSNTPFYNIFLDSLNLTAFEESKHESFIVADMFNYYEQANDVPALLDLFFLLTEQVDSFALACIYRADLFKQETMDNLLSWLKDILYQLTIEPSNCIDIYPVNVIQDNKSQEVNSKKPLYINTTSKILKLFCLPGGDGSYAIFKRFVKTTNYYKPYAIKYKTAENTNSKITIEEVASAIIHEVSALKTYEPFALLGLSYGGLVAFEICQQLHAMKKHLPSQLILLDPPPPAVDIQSKKKFSAMCL